MRLPATFAVSMLVHAALVIWLVRVPAPQPPMLMEAVQVALVFADAPEAGGGQPEPVGAVEAPDPLPPTPPLPAAVPPVGAPLPVVQAEDRPAAPVALPRSVVPVVPPPATPVAPVPPSFPAPPEPDVGASPTPARIPAAFTGAPTSPETPAMLPLEPPPDERVAPQFAEASASPAVPTTPRPLADAPDAPPLDGPTVPPHVQDAPIPALESASPGAGPSPAPPELERPDAASRLPLPPPAPPAVPAPSIRVAAGLAPVPAVFGTRGAAAAVSRGPVVRDPGCGGAFTYPEAARRLGAEGMVLLRLRVAADGAVASAEVIQGSGFPVLDRAALGSALRCRFDPALDGGQPVAGSTPWRVTYRLER